MSSIAAISAYDGASTPVTHTFSPVSVSREGNATVAKWREQVAGLPVEAQIRVTATMTNLKNGIVQSRLRVEVPVMEAIGAQNAAGYTAAPKVAFVDTCEVTSYAHQRSTITSRRLCRQLAVNIANNVIASVAAATTGPAPEMMDSLIAPT